MPSILIIDDDPGTCDTLARGLRLAGFDAAAATSVEGARALLRARFFDLLLIDQRLGPITGLELQRQLQRDGCRAPFTVMSAYMDPPTAVEAMRQGALNALSGPIDINELPGILRADLERYVARSRENAAQVGVASGVDLETNRSGITGATASAVEPLSQPLSSSSCPDGKQDSSHGRA